MGPCLREDDGLIVTERRPVILAQAGIHLAPSLIHYVPI